MIASATSSGVLAKADKIKVGLGIGYAEVIA
jgi:hypothetical protein